MRAAVGRVGLVPGRSPPIQPAEVPPATGVMARADATEAGGGSSFESLKSNEGRDGMMMTSNSGIITQSAVQSGNDGVHLKIAY